MDDLVIQDIHGDGSYAEFSASHDYEGKPFVALLVVSERSHLVGVGRDSAEALRDWLTEWLEEGRG